MGVVKTPKIQQCALYQTEIFHITFALLLVIRKPSHLADQSDPSQREMAMFGSGLAKK